MMTANAEVTEIIFDIAKWHGKGSDLGYAPSLKLLPTIKKVRGIYDETFGVIVNQTDLIISGSKAIPKIAVCQHD